jgi:hypothetical protein
MPPSIIVANTKDNATPKERELDPRDPNDNAFILVSVLKNCA